MALSPVTTATNVISYFSFRNEPPLGHLELGAMVDDWDSFYINIQAVANEVAFRGVECSSINATTTYRQGRLRLDPVAVVRDGAVAKGMVDVDFRRDLLKFDVEGGLPPAAIEDVACPKLDLFGDEIATRGEVRIAGRGVVDWGTMQQTDFTATVQADRLEVPVGIAEGFEATVSGKGPWISVQDADFSLYGGDASGNFRIELNPETQAMPYTFEVELAKVDLKQFVEFFVEGERDVNGRLNGRMQGEADMSTNFFAVANGSGSVQVADGQLADLPLFKGFSKVVRKVIPGFKTFSITCLDGDFKIENGVCSSEKLQFTGDVMSASGRGSYHPDTGFDAIVQAHMLSDSGLAKVIRAITDPLTKIFEMRLTGSLADPSWKLEALP